jgi:predicted small secreted protein
MRYLTIIAIFGLFACNTVQKSLKKKEAIDAAIADYVARNPPRSDTVYLPGVERIRYDTIVNENIYVDTIRVQDTVYIRKVRYQDIVKTIMKTDTMFQVLVDDAGALMLRKQLDRQTGELDAKKRNSKALLIAVILLSASLLTAVLIRLFYR